MRTDGLRLDQAPPLAIPVAFFLLFPLHLVGAGALLASVGSAALHSPWSPTTAALAHLGALGMLGSVMLGALYQLVPVVAGAPVPRVRLAWAVWAAWLVGTVALPLGLATGVPALVQLARGALSLALVGFLVPVGLAVRRSTADLETRLGLGLALASLAGVATLGVWMAGGHAGGTFPFPRPDAVVAHVALGWLGWVGGLLTTVSWQVVPMFYLAPPAPRAARRAMIAALAVGAWSPLAALLLGGQGLLLPLLALPAALAAWVAHPALILGALRRRTRARGDPSLTAWKAALGLGTLLVPLAAVAALVSSSRPAILLGVLVLGGHGGVVVHGMLTRILPFLAWFHRYSGKVGQGRVPSMRSLLPEPVARASLGAHGGAVALAALAAVTGLDPVARLAGLGLLVAGGLAVRTLVTPLRPPAR